MAAAIIEQVAQRKRGMNALPMQVSALFERRAYSAATFGNSKPR